MKYLTAFEKLKSAKTLLDIESAFQDIAHVLINHTQLVIKDESYRIMEIEFYYDNGDSFKDPYIHADERQKTSDNWYFHRKGDGYSDGKIKGLDLTFGNETSLGGILLRGLENITTGEYIDGPSRIVNKILEKNAVTRVVEIAPQLEELKASDLSNLLHLKDYESPVFQIPIKCPRVGLTLKSKKELEQMRYILRYYRFLADPKKTEIHNHSIFLSLVRQGIEEKVAREMAGIREVEAMKYMLNFTRGKERQQAEYVDQKLNVLSHCEMMGAFFK